MSWIHRPVMAFDIETTGVDAESARIVTAAAVLYEPGQDSRPVEWLLNPGVPIPAEATAVHGITDEIAQRDGAVPDTALLNIVHYLTNAVLEGQPLVAMNATFDLTILDRECRRHEILTLKESLIRAGQQGVRPVVDPRVLDKHVDPYRRGSRTLTALCHTYGVELEDAHTAAADAEAAARVTLKIGRIYPHLGHLTLGQLHNSQIAWHAEQVRSFAAYRRKTGNPLDDASTDWSLRPIPTP